MKHDARTLSGRERDVLGLLLEDVGRIVDGAHVEPAVVGRCDCGCPTVHFNDEPVATVLASRRVKGTNDEVLVFVDAAGALSSLEYVWYGDEPPSELPLASELIL